MYRESFMKQALALSARAMETPGTEPFGAVVVLDGEVVGEGFNHSTAHFDPTSHGEIEAIRDACRRLSRLDLSGCDLYSSCEPCAMCAAAIHVTGIRRLYYGASLAQSDRSLAGVPADTRRRVDIDELRRQAGLPLDTRAVPAAQHLPDEAIGIIAAWAAARAAEPAPIPRGA
jgi:guanine deaminase